MRIALGQINPTVGDIGGNTAKIIDYAKKARERGAQVVVFPELGVFGYPPKDLLRRGSLIADNLLALERIAAASEGICIIVGYVAPVPDNSGKGIYNAAAVCLGGQLVQSYAKRLLPTYDVFDEARYFSPGEKPCVVSLPAAWGNHKLGITICEDIWNDAQFGGRPVYGVNPVADTVAAGATMIINIGASPFVAGKHFLRESIFGPQVQRHRIPLIALNQVGANDDLLFDGASFALDAGGHVAAQAPAFEETLLVFDSGSPDPDHIFPYPGRTESIHAALVLGITDYLTKCGFGQTLLGLSGGIDSAVTAALAVEALGKDAVWGVAMPSRFSSDHSVEDARQLADNLGIELKTIGIEPVHTAMESVLRPHFGATTPGLAEENIQARLRGNILMALSNKFGRLLLTTGNKSELAVGYCTLYGDMCGGLAVLCDVPKTVVYELAEHINRLAGREVIPRRTIDKPPSAELRADQLDQDSLPPYDELDAILERFVERDESAAEIIRQGFDAGVVHDVLRSVDKSEYKRQQAPLGLKVTSRAFGSGRRMPIAARFSPLP